MNGKKNNDSPSISSVMESNITEVYNDAIRYIVAGNDPFIPFSSTWDASGKCTIQTSFHIDYGKAVEQAFEYVKMHREDLKSYCVAWSGYRTVPEGRFDAIFIDAAEKDSPESHQFVQRYVFTEETNDFQIVGQMILFQNSVNLLR